MKRWPPIIWPAMAVASLLILMGIGGDEDWALVAGIALEVFVFAASVLLALRARRSRRWPSWAPVLFGALAAAYGVAAAAAAINGAEYLGIVILAALIPASALLLLIATVGAKGRDPAGGDGDDPAPGIGPDEETPVGDTAEHSEAPEGAPLSRPGS
jgi:peptidoglycan/LPS O-acetylase OafA/YrhL